MQTLSVSEVQDRLNELVDAAAITHDQVTITKDGSPAAVLIGAAHAVNHQVVLSATGRRNMAAIPPRSCFAGLCHRGKRHPPIGSDV